MIGFIDTLYTPLRTIGIYSTIDDLHTLQFTVTHALGFSVFTSRILAMDLEVSLLVQITHEVFFSLPKSFIAIIQESCHNMKNFRKYGLERICISQIPYGLTTSELGYTRVVLKVMSNNFL
jgi:hypothetical protein